MKVVATIAELRSHLAASVGPIGAVPTMGALHAGHVSLIERARSESATVVASIFVNPLQFGRHEDLDLYPRPLESDAQKAADAGVDLLFTPSVSEMCPEPMLTVVSVASIASRLEGASRPGHFDGVATVVAKLFAIFGPCSAYFGEKDYQQLAVIRRMASDLAMPVRVVACPTVREPDGLALSSRNVFLSPEQRAGAPVLHRALVAGREAVGKGEREASKVHDVMAKMVAREPLIALDYAEAVDTSTFETPADLTTSEHGIRLLIAARFGTVRLIDNISCS